MEMTLKLYKKEGTYFDAKAQRDKPYTNFYIQCNDQLIPVEVKYFPNPKTDNRDPGYQGRFAVLSAFAELLPEREKKTENAAEASAAAAPATSTTAAPAPSDDDVPAF